MDVTRAFSYIFEDEDWVGKLVMVIIWTLVAAIPLIGLIGAAALAGYAVELLRNMRKGEAAPLPRWDNVGDKIMDGANVLIAAFVYNLGNILLICGMMILTPAFGLVSEEGAAAMSTIALAITCCLSVLILAYNLVVWPLVAVGTIYYSQSGQINAYFQLGRIWGTVNRYMGPTIQWLLFSILAGFVIGLFNIVPCLGWLAGLALGLPVQAHLLGQFAGMIDDKPKNKPKPKPKRVEPR